MPDSDALAAALAGDETGFRRLVDPHRRELHAHCYRILGSVHDADDALQDTLLRAWRGLPRFEEGRPLRPWLYKIATNVCLDEIARRPTRILPMDHGPPTDPSAGTDETPVASIWVEPYPDELLTVESPDTSPEARYEQRETLELAFITALQHLPGRQRAVVVLREVLAFSAREVAEMLETTVPSVNSALQRARKTIEERVPDESQQAALRSLGNDGIRDLVERFINALEEGDIDGVLALLAEDATFAMPPYPNWCRGRDAVSRSWLMPDGPPPRLRCAVTRASGQLALGSYLLDAAARRFFPIALDVLTLRGDLISEVIAFRTPEVFAWFGLPDELALEDR
jgi:RNA polymerase sigma-70 factor (ECF subfamily)